MYNGLTESHTDAAYMEWLHNLTIEAYKYDIRINASAGPFIREQYDEGKTVEQVVKTIMELMP